MNPFGFLGKLPGVISGGVKTGIRKLGEMDDGAESGMLKPPMPRTGPGGTGGFAGNEGLPQIGGQRGLINRPEPMPTTMPQLQRPEMPKLEPIRDGASVSANLPMGNAETSPLSGQMIAERPVPTVRPPDFLGRKGATMDDTPLNHERYAYENQYMQEGRHPRRWQDIAMTALHGANEGFKSTGDWRGALAGAGVGAGGAAISPQGARRLRFDREQLPGITASRQEMERGQDRSFEMQKRGAMMEGEQTQNELRRAQLERAKRPDPRYADASWGTYDRSTGKPEYIRPQGAPSTAAPRRYRVGDDLVDETGKVIYRGTPSAERPVSVAPGNTLVNPKTGQPVYSAPERPKARSREATEALQGVNELKQAAIQAWNKAKNIADPAQRAEAEAEARAALEDYNQSALGLAEMFPEDFEAGEGEGGWNYAKPKGSVPQIQRRGGNNAQGGTAKISDLKKLLQ